MLVYKISSFTRHPIYSSVNRCGSMKNLSIQATRLNCFRYFSSNADTNYKSGGLWNFTKRWEFCVPIGLGISLVAILQWRHRRKYPYPIESNVVKGPINDFMVDCYCSLPLRITSRIFGWFASVEVPKVLRPILYRLYAKTFHANLNEIDLDLSSFPSLVEFFVRPLKDGARPIDDSEIVSPSDGTVLHFGPVTSCRVEQVKGITYNLRHFLGDMKIQKTEFTPQENDNYVKSLLFNQNNQLYQLIIYLAPGDYHRFHSATNWQINLRRHFQGKLLSVNPRVASWLPDLFALNERVVYIGGWNGGFMAYAAVGATNVGSIKVYCDKTLMTNKHKWAKGKIFEDTVFDSTNISKGELFGEFRMGSTVVLLFEAPKDFHFCINIGQTIKAGQALTEHAINKNSTMIC